MSVLLFYPVVGKYKTKLIADCRDLLKSDKADALYALLRGHLNLRQLKKDVERARKGEI